jgi:EAL domain-containing protein (putative c-di-GMP-specific phosphodiesterase class I)
MDVIAEGIETVEQLMQLSALQCKYGQGYFFSHPLDTQAAGALIAKSLCGMDKSYRYCQLNPNVE